MLRRALLVDTNADRLHLLRREIGKAVDVETCIDFQAARDCLLKTSPAFLISHLRLGAYNGLHLAHLAAHARLETRCLLYDEPLDIHLALEAQLIGAFFETTSRLPFVVPAYVRSSLPERDRRDARRIERRELFRGGRRATDLKLDQFRGSSSSLLH